MRLVRTSENFKIKALANVFPGRYLLGEGIRRILLAKNKLRAIERLARGAHRVEYAQVVKSAKARGISPKRLELYQAESDFLSDIGAPQ